MKLRNSRAARFAAALLIAPVALTPMLATPAHAIIVFDPSNYAQNVLTAARSLQQITNQITSLQIFTSNFEINDDVYSPNQV